MGVTLIHKSKLRKAYPLSCSIPTYESEIVDHVEGEGEKAKPTGVKKASQTERVLTLGPNEKRTNLPEAVLASPAIKAAIAKKQIFVQKQVAKAAGPVAPAPKEPKNQKQSQAAASSEK